MADLAVMDAASTAHEALDPLKLRLLSALHTPASASELARRFNLPRQKLNYHLKQLESAGLISIAEERRKRNCIELLYKRSADHYVLDPALLGDVGAPEINSQERFSWTTLVALLVRSLRECLALRREADASAKKLATFSMDMEVAFTSPKAMHDFAEEAAATLHALAQKYHQGETPKARRYRLVCISHAVHQEGGHNAPQNDHH